MAKVGVAGRPSPPSRGLATGHTVVLPVAVATPVGRPAYEAAAEVTPATPAVLARPFPRPRPCVGETVGGAVVATPGDVVDDTVPRLGRDPRLGRAQALGQMGLALHVVPGLVTGRALGHEGGRPILRPPEVGHDIGPVGPKVLADVVVTGHVDTDGPPRLAARRLDALVRLGLVLAVYVATSVGRPATETGDVADVALGTGPALAPRPSPPAAVVRPVPLPKTGPALRRRPAAGLATPTQPVRP